MSGETKSGNAALTVLTVLLALICAAGGYLLYTGWTPPQPQESAAEVTFPVPETIAVQTTVTTTAPETTTTTAATTAPDPHAPYLEYLQDTLLPEQGTPDTSGPAPSSEQTGIAGTFFADLRDTGSDDMVVIRLDLTDSSLAALPVILWYGLTGENTVTLLDTFEVKPQWSGYSIRYADKVLYLSGEYLDADADAGAWRFTEVAVAFQPDPDLVLQDIQDEHAANRPEPMYPEGAELLLEMQLDTAKPIAPMTDRRYLLRTYTEYSGSAAKPEP